MSLLTISKSLKKFVSNSRNFSSKKFENTKKHLKTYEFLSTDAALKSSLKITKKIAYMCNQRSHTDGDSKLKTAEELLIA